MAKKKVRKGKKKQSQSPVQSAAAAEVIATSRSKMGRPPPDHPGRQAGIPKKITSVDQLKDEYSYVLKDLRLIFAIAAVMFLILFGLNLVLG